MARSEKTLQLKSILTWILISAFTTQAFAMPLAAAKNKMSDPTTPKIAMHDIDVAEHLRVESYFRSGTGAQAIQNFNDDFLRLAEANNVVGLADHLEEFKTWWEAHSLSVVESRAKMTTGNLEGFFTEALIAFERDRTAALEDPNEFLSWLSARVTNPVVRQISSSAFTITVGVFTFGTGIVYGAVVAGPVAGSVGAFLEPVVRPIREKVGVLGSRWLGGIGVRLNAKLYKESAAASKAHDELTVLTTDVKAAKKAQVAARALMNTMSLDMSPAGYVENMTKMKEIWNETNQAWSKIHPAIFKDGRNLTWEALYFRPQAFSSQVMQSLTASEVFRQGIEHTIDRIVSGATTDRKTVEAKAKEFIAAVDETEKSDQAQPQANKDALEKVRGELIAQGASPDQTERIQQNRVRELMFAKQTATTLASSVVHDFHFEEFNRSLPEVVMQTQKVFRAGFCIDYFHHEFAAEVQKILTDLEFKTSLMEKVTASAGTQSHNSPAPVVKNESTAKTTAKATSEPVTKRGLRDRATSALKRLNSFSQNRLAVERDPSAKELDRASETAHELVFKK